MRETREGSRQTYRPGGSGRLPLSKVSAYFWLADSNSEATVTVIVGRCVQDKRVVVDIEIGKCACKSGYGVEKTWGMR